MNNKQALILGVGVGFSFAILMMAAMHAEMGRKVKIMTLFASAEFN